MAKINQIYRCEICGHIVEVIHDGQGRLVCCGQGMELLKEKVHEVGSEKHVPVVKKTDRGVQVKVGGVPHPMDASHYIEWIELVSNGRAYRRYLKPGDLPGVEFGVRVIKLGESVVRIYCNQHGLWRNS